MATASMPGSVLTDDSAEQPAQSNAASHDSLQPAWKQPRLRKSLAEWVAPPCNHAFALGLWIHWLPPRELARGCLGAVCQQWLQIHREQAWLSLVLTAGDPHLLYTDWDAAGTHGTIKSFTAAPSAVRELASSRSQSLTLIIENLDELFDCYDDFMQLQFPKVERLVIEGPIFHEHLRGLPLFSVVDGLRFGLFVSKFTSTVTSLIVRASVCDENDNPHPIIASIVSSFPHLIVLDIPTIEHQLYPVPPMPRTLKCCQGLGVNIHAPQESFLAKASELKQVHITVHNWNTMDDELADHDELARRKDYDCTALFLYLRDHCSQLLYLHIDFIGQSGMRQDAFSYLSPYLRWLVISFDDVLVEGQLLHARHLSGAAPTTPSDAAETICKHLRPLVPELCQLYVLKGPFTLDVECATVTIMSPQFAASA